MLCYVSVFIATLATHHYWRIGLRLMRRLGLAYLIAHLPRRLMLPMQQRIVKMQDVFQNFLWRQSRKGSKFSFDATEMPYWTCSPLSQKNYRMHIAAIRMQLFVHVLMLFGPFSTMNSPYQIQRMIRTGFWLTFVYPSCLEQSIQSIFLAK